MEYYITCPACRMTDVEPTQTGRGAGDKYLCIGCNHGFTIRYRKTPQTIVEQYWKRVLIAALIIL